MPAECKSRESPYRADSGMSCSSRLSRRVTVSPGSHQGQGAPTSWNLSKIGVTLRMRSGPPSRRPAFRHAGRRGSDASQEDRCAIVQALRERSTAVAVQPTDDDGVVGAYEDVRQLVRIVLGADLTAPLTLAHERRTDIGQDAVGPHVAEVQDAAGEQRTVEPPVRFDSSPHGLEQASHLLRRRSVPVHLVLQHLPVALHSILGRLLEDGVLAREVVEERRLADLELSYDVLDRHLVESAFLEELDRVGQDLPA